METKNINKAEVSGREISISRTLNAPIELVWEVWTNPDHIKNWWGPNGFTNTITKMEMKPQGVWELIMHGPDGTDYKNKSVFVNVEKYKQIIYEHSSAPKFTATVTFTAKGKTTVLNWQMLFETREEMLQTVKVFKADEGLKQNVEKLESYMQAQLNLRKQFKTDHMARVCTYLNFPGNTEEAFNFYRSVFGGEFAGKGIQRFGDIPAQAGHPPLSDSDKKLILHIELEILGGHVIMATDAPASMGFTLTPGNNMHISLEPETKKETKRLFDGLSKGGKVTMELQDMFFGSYFGSCTDKFGINWMFNCLNKE